MMEYLTLNKQASGHPIFSILGWWIGYSNDTVKIINRLVRLDSNPSQNLFSINLKIKKNKIQKW
jgi:hypothetical protein